MSWVSDYYTGGWAKDLFDTGADEAQAKNEQNLHFIRNLYGKPGGGKLNSLFGQLEQGYGQGTPMLMQALFGAQGAKQNALSAIGGAGSEAYRQIADQTKQATASARQRGISSGLYNTSAGIVGENQARYMGQRAMGSLGASIGSGLASTELAGQAGITGALSQLANYFAQRGRDMGTLGGQLGGLSSQFQWSPTQSPFQQYVAPLAYAAGSFIGG